MADVSAYPTKGQTRSLDMLLNDFIKGSDDKLFEFVDDKNLRGKVWKIHSIYIKSTNIKFNRHSFFKTLQRFARVI